MKLTVHLEGKDKAELVKGLHAHLALFGDTTQTGAPAVKTTTTQTTTAKAAPAPTTKKAAKAIVATEDEEDDTEFEIDGGDSADEMDLDASADDEDEESEEETADEEETEEAITLQDVIGACSKYAKKHSREKVSALLKKKFQAATVRELKPAQYAAVVKALA